MRVLVTTSPAIGHIHPVVPLARALVAAGNEVRWVTGPDGCLIVQAAGLTSVGAGMDARGRREEYYRRYPEAHDLPPEQLPAHMFPRVFGTIGAPAMLRDLLPIVESWTPDVIVHEAGELAAPIAAAVAGVPNVCQGFGALLRLDRIGPASEAVAPLWREQGLEPRPWAGSYDHLYLDIYPPSLRGAYGDYVTRRESMRPVPFSVDLINPADARVVLDADDRPLVYVTFGTVFNDPGVAFRAAVEGVADLDVRVLVTVGPDGDPEAFGAVPANVNVIRYLPQTDLLPRCSLVVSHAGSGTFLAALDHGLAQLCVPQAADQFGNAQQCAEAGAGLRLLPDDVSRETVRESAVRLLNEPDFRANAGRVQQEIGDMRPPQDVVAMIHDLTCVTDQR